MFTKSSSLPNFLANFFDLKYFQVKVAALNVLKGEPRDVDYIECETREARLQMMLFVVDFMTMMTMAIVIYPTYQSSCCQRRSFKVRFLSIFGVAWGFIPEADTGSEGSFANFVNFIVSEIVCFDFFNFNRCSGGWAQVGLTSGQHGGFAFSGKGQNTNLFQI